MAGVYNSFEIKCENENDAKKAKQIAEKIISESNTQIETESDLWNPIDTNATTINAENYERFDIDDCYLSQELFLEIVLGIVGQKTCRRFMGLHSFDYSNVDATKYLFCFYENDRLIAYYMESVDGEKYLEKRCDFSISDNQTVLQEEYEYEYGSDESSNDVGCVWDAYYYSNSPVMPDKKGETKDDSETIAVSIPATLQMTFEECKEKYKCYSEDGNVMIMDIKEDVSELHIPGKVDGMPVVITQGAFSGMQKLEKVVINDGAIAIGADAFSDCGALKDVSIPKSIVEAGGNCFAETPWRNKQGDWFVINETLVKYTGEEKKVSIPDGIRQIAPHAFMFRNMLESIEIPESVEHIGDGAFSFCRKLNDIHLNNQNVEFDRNPFDGTKWAASQEEWIIMGSTLFGCSFKGWSKHSKEENLIIPEGIKTISDAAFSNGVQDWSNIKRICLPEGLETIGAMAFKGLQPLEEIVLPDSLLRIKEFAFGETGLKTVILPKSLVKIGEWSFARCKSLKQVSIPGTIKEIPDAVFNGCESLEIVDVPSSVESFGRSVFGGCPNLTVNVDNNSTAEQYLKDNEINYKMF